MHKTLLIAAATHLSVSTQSATRWQGAFGWDCEGGGGGDWGVGQGEGEVGVRGRWSCSSGHRA